MGETHISGVFFKSSLLPQPSIQPVTHSPSLPLYHLTSGKKTWVPFYQTSYDLRKFYVTIVRTKFFRKKLRPFYKRIRRNIIYLCFA